MVRVLLVLVVLTVVLGPGQAKVYGRCELAKRLRQLGASESQLATWVCIAHRESGYNTAALNTNKNKSKDLGIFQINNRYWCDKGSRSCGVSCSALQDDDVANDFRCAQHIYSETKRFNKNKGDGFSAWVAYRSHCTNGRAASYLDGC